MSHSRDPKLFCVYSVLSIFQALGCGFDTRPPAPTPKPALAIVTILSGDLCHTLPQTDRRVGVGTIRVITPWKEVSNMARAIRKPEPARCPSCGSTNFTTVESSLIDRELLECESCLRAYEVKHDPDGSERLVAV